MGRRKKDKKEKKKKKKKDKKDKKLKKMKKEVETRVRRRRLVDGDDDSDVVKTEEGVVKKEEVDDESEEEMEEESEEEDEPRRSRFEDVASEGDDEEEEEVSDQDKETPEQIAARMKIDASRRKHREEQRKRMEHWERIAKEEEEEGEAKDEDIAGSEVSEGEASEERGIPLDKLNQMSAQRGLYPTISDPKLFMVRVKPGYAKPLCAQLMYKSLSFAFRGQDLMIKSVFCRDHLPDYLYIEAHRQVHVENAVSGMQGVYRSKIQLVPLPEMPATLAVTRKVSDIGPGSWGRFRYGLHKGDLCRIVKKDDDKATHTVHVIPRVDWSRFLENESARGAGVFRTQGQRQKGRPVQRFFGEDEWGKCELSRDGTVTMAQYVAGQQGAAKTEEAKALASRGVIFVRGRYFSLQGHEEKTVRQAQISTEGKIVDASVDEIERFCRHQLPSGSNHLKALKRTREVEFQRGDDVRVMRGELRGAMGTIREAYTDATGTKFRVEITSEEVMGGEESAAWVPLTKDMIEKIVYVGDHVRIAVGAHKGQTGMVTSVQGRAASVLSHVLGHEVNVFVSDLVKSQEVSRGVPRYGGYELMELVRLQDGTTGVILHMQDSYFRVLCDQGEVGVYPHGEVLEVISSTRQSERSKGRRQSTLDRFDNEMCQDDVVKVINNSSPWSGVVGNVKHICADAVWVLSSACPTNMGVFVTRNTDLRVQGGETRRVERDEAFFEKKQAALRHRPDDDDEPAPTAKRSKRDPLSLVGMRVRIIEGYYKGYLGIVRQVHLAQASIELHTGEKLITVAEDRIRVVGASDTLAPPEARQRYAERQRAREKDVAAAPLVLPRAAPVPAPVRAPSEVGTAVSAADDVSVFSDMRSLSGLGSGLVRSRRSPSGPVPMQSVSPHGDHGLGGLMPTHMVPLPGGHSLSRSRQGSRQGSRRSGSVRSHLSAHTGLGTGRAPASDLVSSQQAGPSTQESGARGATQGSGSHMASQGQGEGTGSGARGATQ
eukprot:Hpha_TRINITY_DN15997_c10_g5::TRINITY_DN15997_c10_g5_i1::g.70314::m.70314/K15172/SUPT5H, SPT5; transcription elongation factor SPT5